VGVGEGRVYVCVVGEWREWDGRRDGGTDGNGDGGKRYDGLHGMILAREKVYR